MPSVSRPALRARGRALILDAWCNVLIFPSSEAPRYHAGYKVSLGLWIFAIIMIIALRLYDIKIQK
jgi:hypothetical protein